MSEKQFLIDDFKVGDTWRLFKIISEFVEGFEMMSEVYPAVSIFGSARIKPEDETYKMTVEIAKKLSENGFNIITGGGPGIMEAGNKGAQQGKGKSVGVNIKLPMEQQGNAFTDLQLELKYFLCAK